MRLSHIFPALLALTASALATPLVYVAIGAHNEDPANADTPDTPFASNLTDYGTFRHGIDLLANTMNSLGIPWCPQHEWNFLEGCRQCKINNPQVFPDNTGGLNIIRWLREVRGRK